MGRPRKPRAAPPAVVGPVMGQQVAAPDEYSCNFCERCFTSCNGLSGHYNKHKDLDHVTWARNGPKGSKIRKGILQAWCEGRPYEYKKRVWKSRSKARAQAWPEPVRAKRAGVVGQVVRVQGRGGLLVVKNQLADSLLRSHQRARLLETRPPVEIQGPDGPLIRRDFVALEGGAAKTGPVGRAQEPGEGSSSSSGLAAKFPASRLFRSIKKEVIIID